ncbi:MAG: hypothetical protein WEB93_01750, partial [Sphingomonadales bacterium]
ARTNITGESPTGRGNQQHPGGAFRTVVQFTVLAVVLAVLAFPTFLVLLMGMAPTLVSIVVAERMERHRLTTMAAFNLCGVMIFLGSLWTDGHTMDHAIRLLSDVYVWATMYMAAAVGAVAIWAGPQVAAVATNIMSLRHKSRYHAMRLALIDEWGTDVVPASEPQSSTESGKSEDRTRNAV